MLGMWNNEEPQEKSSTFWINQQFSLAFILILEANNRAARRVKNAADKIPEACDRLLPYHSNNFNIRDRIALPDSPPKLKKKKCRHLYGDNSMSECVG